MLHRASRRRFHLLSSTAWAARVGAASLVTLLLSAGMPSSTGVLPIAAAQAQPARALRTELMKPRSHQALMRDAARHKRLVVLLFSLPGCPFCEAVRREQLLPLAQIQDEQRLWVVEYEINDHRRFDAASHTDAAPGQHAAAAGARRTSAAGAQRTTASTDTTERETNDSPAALARSFGIRIAPTVVFIDAGGELAERLVGYASADFYGAYLDQRIAQALAKIDAR